MHGRAALFLLLLFGLAAPAQAWRIPIREIEPSVLEAARNFVRALPIRDEFTGATIAPRVTAVLLNEAARRHPHHCYEQLTFQNRVAQRVDRLLPDNWPALEEQVARALAPYLPEPAMNAGADFFRTPNGGALASRFAWQDPTIAMIVQQQLIERLLPDLEAMLAEVDASEQLRQRANASGRRR